MHASNFSLASYFSRIGFAASSENKLNVAEMMCAQLYSIPFENLDVLAGLGVSMAPEDIVEKLIHRRRGGYCYELNGIFAMALAALAIPYRFVAARPMFYPVRRPKTHMAIVAEYDRHAWLLDLGFGSYGIREPIPLLESDQEIVQGHDRFKLSRWDNGEYLLEAWVNGAWAKQYAFADNAVEWIDFYPVNYLNSTHKDAIFVQKHVIILHNQQGRNMLVGDTLKTIREGTVTETKVTAEQLPSLLDRYFGISLLSGQTA
jgi:N-hydroxyarylamine O-acetyltransferase